MTDFDWQRDGSVLCREQSSVAIYPNLVGQIVIRAEARWDEEHDPVIVVNPEHAVAVAYAVLDAGGCTMEIVEQVGGGWCDVPRPDRPTPAEPEKAERLALPAPNHACETVTPDLFARGANAEPR